MKTMHIACLLKNVSTYLSGSCRAAFVMGAGDLVMQHYNGVEHPDDINWRRNVRFAAVGFCIVGPFLTHWSEIFFSTMAARITYSSLAVRQLICDQLYLAPSLNLGVFILHGLLNKENSKEIENRINDQYLLVMKRHYAVLPAAQLFTQIFIQPNLQLIFASGIGIIWFAYLSGILHNDPVVHTTSQLKFPSSAIQSP